MVSAWGRENMYIQNLFDKSVYWIKVRSTVRLSTSDAVVLWTCISYRTWASVSVKRTLWVEMLAFAINHIEDAGNNPQSSDMTQRRHPSDKWLAQPRSAFGGILWARNTILRFGLQSDTKTLLASFYKSREITIWRTGESLSFT